jgi:hypothetical protein
MEDEVAIPKEFWATVSSGEWTALFGNGGFLNAEQCARLWRMTDRQTTPPRCLKVLINAADLMEAFPPSSRPQRRARSRAQRKAKEKSAG